jgi:hypothetical protein
MRAFDDGIHAIAPAIEFDMQSLKMVQYHPSAALKGGR